MLLFIRKIFFDFSASVKKSVSDAEKKIQRLKREEKMLRQIVAAREARCRAFFRKLLKFLLFFRARFLKKNKTTDFCPAMKPRIAGLVFGFYAELFLAFAALFNLRPDSFYKEKTPEQFSIFSFRFSVCFPHFQEIFLPIFQFSDF